VAKEEIMTSFCESVKTGFEMTHYSGKWVKFDDESPGEDNIYTSRICASMWTYAQEAAKPDDQRCGFKYRDRNGTWTLFEESVPEQNAYGFYLGSKAKVVVDVNFSSVNEGACS
jgi:hypothetical protein